MLLGLALVSSSCTQYAPLAHIMTLTDRYIGYILRLPKHTRPVAERHVSRPSSVGAQSELALSRRSDLEVSYLVNFPEKPVTACSDDWAEDQTLSVGRTFLAQAYSG
jgi:hypothetical protein